MSCLANCTKCTLNGPRYCCSDFCLIFENETSGLCNYRKTDGEPIRCPVVPQLPESSNVITYVVLIGSVLLVLLALAAATAWLYRRQSRLESLLTKREAVFFFEGDSETTHINGYAHECTDNLPYNKELEIPESEFTADWSNPLGQGCYGLVLKGMIRNSIQVAAKTIRSGNGVKDGGALRSLMSEIKVLQYIGNAENIVCMMGAYTEKLREGKIFMFLEFCPLGSLEKYLRNNKESFRLEEKKVSNEYENIKSEPIPENVYSVEDMRLWCKQITKAMEFLEDKKVIHADLATRNVLLLRKDWAKVTDFGLSRRLYDYSNYVKQHQEPLPWRWMAIESLKQLSFSHKSDVWSLGATLWEIHSLGDVPYAGLSWTPDFVSSLEDGSLRPSKPSAASHELYELMLDCWKASPGARPSFKEISARLNIV